MWPSSFGSPGSTSSSSSTIQFPQLPVYQIKSLHNCVRDKGTSGCIASAKILYSIWLVSLGARLTAEEDNPSLQPKPAFGLDRIQLVGAM